MGGLARYLERLAVGRYSLFSPTLQFNTGKRDVGWGGGGMGGGGGENQHVV